MAFENIIGFEQGLVNRADPRDIRRIAPFGLSKAQNISVEKMGRILTVGGLETHGEVPTHAAVLNPGNGLFTYGSDHWRALGTIETLFL